MKINLLATIALLLIASVWAKAADESPSDQPPTSAPAEDIDPHPWNPDVLHANEWPYKKPLTIPSEFYGPPGEFWLRGEYYLWNLKGDHLPPLVSNGTLGQPGVAP